MYTSHVTDLPKTLNLHTCGQVCPLDSSSFRRSLSAVPICPEGQADKAVAKQLKMIKVAPVGALLAKKCGGSSFSIAQPRPKSLALVSCGRLS
jgi:hypothetical protein